MLQDSPENAKRNVCAVQGESERKESIDKGKYSKINPQGDRQTAKDGQKKESLK